LLVRTARKWPHLPAVALGRDLLHDYAALARRAARMAAALAAAGMRPGERVALISHNVPEYIETLFGCWWAGLVVVPVNAKLHPNELRYVLANSGARLAFVDAGWNSALGAFGGGVLPSDTPSSSAAATIGDCSQLLLQAHRSRVNKAILRGCFTPAGQRADRRASSSRTAICSR
jgi:long-chain acyl-CoA synthetase